MDTLRQDVAYAFRRLVRAPGFTMVAAATLALGIGANSAIFSVTNAVLLQPLPYDEPERLVRLAQTWEGRFTGVYSPQNFLDVAAQAKSFESLAALDGGGVTLTGRGAPARLDGAAVSTSFFDVLRVRPVLGRGFEEGENEPGRTRVAVLGHRLWSQRFGGDAGIVGRTIQLDRDSYEVVGVAPPGFSYPEDAEIWRPLEYDELFRSKSRGAWYLTVIGRLRPGAPLQEAREEVGTIAARLAQDYPDANEGVGGDVKSLHESMVSGSRPALLVLLGAVGLVLLIACVNVANLLLARVAARETELAVRSALGAGRGRLLRQLLTESVLLALLGGAAGLLLASFSMDALVGLQPQGVPRLAEVRLDRSVLAFAAGISILTGVLFGAFPALHMTRRTTALALREGGRGLLGGRGGRLRGGLVVGQMALAMVLLTGAGLLVRSFVALREVDPGFKPEGVLAFRTSLPESAYTDESQRAAFYRDLLAQLRALPGVRSAAAVSGLPLSGARFSISFEVAGRPPLPPAQQPSMEVRVCSVDYFRTMGIPVLRGRVFEETDTAEAGQVAVLSEAAVRRFFAGEDPLGQRITVMMGREPGRPRPGGEVIGVVGDVKDRGLALESLPEIYLLDTQLPIRSMDVVLRATVPPLSLARAAESAVHEIDPELPLARVVTLESLLARSLSQPRFYMVLLAAFAAMALLLAALGIFGVMSYAVVQRSREIGIRVALGAPRADVLRMVLAHALGLALGGVALGFVGALALSRTLTSLLFNLSPTDPATLAAVGVILTAVAVVASYLPARQAARVDPVVSLRSE